MFYPQLVAGPIERPQHILPQLKEEHRLDYNATTTGLKRMAWGFFQKVVVADRLALVANPVFADPRHHHGLISIVGAVAFTFQIYLDFAGYSNIAIGAAQVLGIRLMTNFRQPFHARSISEFWARWHISLSTWFRDYLYIPLGGNRVSKARHYVNLMTVFVVSGLWHGASWNFVVWGALHGFYLVVALLLTPRLPRVFREGSGFLVTGWNVASVFVLVCLAFVFFRAGTIADALTIIRQMHVGLLGDLKLVAHRDLVALAHGRGLPLRRDWLIAGVGLAIVQVVELLEGSGGVQARLDRLPGWLRWQVYAGLVYSIVLFANTARVQFIYFQF
jgi:D-alanyl-lipoteichoic acid acyltransferase DltB (MBOAT superfamily)